MGRGVDTVAVVAVDVAGVRPGRVYHTHCRRAGPRDSTLAGRSGHCWGSLIYRPGDLIWTHCAGGLVRRSTGLVWKHRVLVWSGLILALLRCCY